MSYIQSAEWECWLDTQIESTKEVYSSDPERITSDYNREVKQRENYTGRGLLELIQNADDAGLNSSSSVDVLIQLTDVGLFVANSGESFSRDGIKSLMLSDNSPKQFREECIGYKGLGFRSVLNWSSSVVIHSGKVSIGFSETYAAEFLDELRREYEEVEDLLNRRYRGSEVTHPIATLSTPRLLSSENIDDAQLQEVYEHGKNLKRDGYNTVICIPLFNSDARTQVKEEINSLFEELMLFLRNIEDFRIQSPEREEHWKIDRSGDTVTILHGGGASSTWELFEDSGQIPQEYRESHQTKDQYEIKVAVPRDFTQIRATSNLFVFFPTKVAFPFPMLAHGTFHVNDSRNHLTKTDANRFVAKQLASTMVEAAEENRSEADPWRALQAVSPTEPIGATLSELGAPKGDADSFEEILRTEIASHLLIPVQNSTYTTPERAWQLSGNFDDLLEGDRFDDICLDIENEDVANQLDALGVEYLEYAELRSRLEEIAVDLSIETRADFITRLIDNDIIGDEVPPRLLIDSEGNLIPPEERAFLPPQDEAISLPSWVPRHVLHSELAGELETRWEDLSGVRELQVKLKPFNVQRYDLATLVQAVVAAANDRAGSTTDSDEEMRWRKKMLRALWSLYQAGAEGVNLSNVSIIVPTCTETFAKASTLYFTSDYPNGELVERLYQDVDPDAFVIGPDELDFCDDVAELEAFFEWLGVATEPRKDRRRLDDSDFYDYVLDSLEYPVSFGSNRLRRATADEVRSTKRTRLTKVQTIDRLEKVLETAEPHAILAWLSSISGTLHDWRREGDQEAVLKIRPKNHQNWKQLRDQTLPSHPLWLLRTVEWLAVENGHGQRRAPRTCSIASFAREFSPLVGYPAILDEMDHPVFAELNVDETAVVNALQNIGVTSSIENLSWEAFYQILSELPDRDRDGEIARRVYRTLVKNRDGEPPTELRERFVENGVMYGTDNGTDDYYPVTELRYTNTDSIPSPIVDRYPILDLDNRLGARKVENLFGVKGLRNADIDISILDNKPHSDAETFENEIESLKPFIYAFRIDVDEDRMELQAIQDLEIVICRSVRATASVAGDEFRFELDEWAYLLDDKKAYVVPGPVLSGGLQFNDRFARLVGDVFSDVLDTKLGKDVLSIATAGDREQRLDVLLDEESPHERLNKAKGLVYGEIDSVVSSPSPGVSDAMERDERNSEKEDRQEEGKAAADPEQNTTDPSARDDRSKDQIKAVSATEKDFEVKQGGTIKLRRMSQGSQGSSSGGAGGSSNAPDWRSAEELAYWFEIDKGRYPMLVSDVQGSDSYRCDVLSFDTKDRKNRFEQGPDSDLIDRYIEVKSSTSLQGGTDLETGQYEQAITQRKKYYLYRIYEPPEKEDPYELTVLRDPLNHDAALSWSVSVNPFKTHETICFTLEPITDEDGDE